MHGTFFRAVCRAGIFMICAQAIAHFRPNESYEKYLKLLISIMVLIQLFLPIGALFAGAGGGEGMDRIEEFRRDLEKSMDEAEEQARRTEEMLESMTLEEVRRLAGEQGGREETEADGGETGTEGSAEEGENAPVSIPEIRLDLEPIGRDGEDGSG